MIMKQFMKMLLFATVICGFMVSCNDDDNDDPQYGEAKFLSFGFYMEDNEDVIFKDYVIENVTGTSIKINLPEEADKTKLVARFTVSENDAVTVDGVTQESGKTINDFTSPIDYIVSEGTNNTKYTVTIGQEASAVWSKAGQFDGDLAMEFIMKINPLTNEPYIAFQQSRDETDNRKAAMVKWSGGTWSFIGDQAGASDGRADDISFTFDKNGKIYMAYTDYTVNYGASVKLFDGSSWSAVGVKNLLERRITFKSIALNAQEQPMVFCMNDDRTAGVTPPRRALIYSTFNASWSAVQTVTGRDNALIAYYPMAITVNDVLYLSVFDNMSAAAGGASYSVYTYSNGAWTTIGDKERAPGATSCNMRDFDMDVDNDGNVFIAVADDAGEAGVYKPRVRKYDAATKKWSNVGDPINVNFADTRYMDVAVSPYGIPTLLYRNANGYPCVVTLDKKTQNWGEPVILESVQVDDLCIEFSPDGIGYAAYVNGDDRIVLHKLDTPAN